MTLFCWAFCRSCFSIVLGILCQFYFGTGPSTFLGKASLRCWDWCFDWGFSPLNSAQMPEILSSLSCEVSPLLLSGRVCKIFSLITKFCGRRSSLEAPELVFVLLWGHGQEFKLCNAKVFFEEKLERIDEFERFRFSWRNWWQFCWFDPRLKIIRWRGGTFKRWWCQRFFPWRCLGRFCRFVSFPGHVWVPPFYRTRLFDVRSLCPARCPC